MEADVGLAKRQFQRVALGLTPAPPCTLAGPDMWLYLSEPAKGLLVPFGRGEGTWGSSSSPAPESQLHSWLDWHV